MPKKTIIKRSIVWPDKGQVYIRGLIDDDNNPIIEFSRAIPFGFETNSLKLSKKEFMRFYEVFEKLNEILKK